MHGFLPSDYEGPPTNSRYFKPPIGRSRVRIIGSAITGSLFWQTTHDGRKPIRRRMNEQVLPSEVEIDPRSGKPEKVKHFWACPIWNVDAGAVQIWEITQATIMDAIIALINTPEWADVTQFDLVISRSGEGLETKYGIAPTPIAPLSELALAEIAATPIDIEALFRGVDPFDAAPAPQADPAAGAPQGGTVETLINTVEQFEKGGAIYWRAITDGGLFGTGDAGVGQQLENLNGQRVRIEWTQLPNGNFRADSVSALAPPASPAATLAHQQPAEDDIPF